jgi:tight adherence protein C
MYLGFALFLLVVFLIVAGTAFGIMDFLLKIRVDSRLDLIRDQSNLDFRAIPSDLERRATVILSSLKALSTPKEEAKVLPIRMKFITAGYHTDLPVLLYFSGKTVLTFLLPLVFLIYVTLSTGKFSFAQTSFTGVCLAAAGYYLPDLFLNHKIRQRQRDIFETFPDALDLMRVCVSAGLGLDAALARVGKEIEFNSAALAEEFHELNLQLRAGMSRQEALRNMAERTGVEDVGSLVSMLIQSERFGTSVSESLKVHADSLRIKRKMLAQEAAGKIPVKLTIPMILCIFPAIFVVILGPAIIQIIRALNPVVGP